MSDLGYEGDCTPEQSWEILENHEKSFLIDCRTIPEWQFVGVPDLHSIDKKVVLIEWQSFPNMVFNEHFLNRVYQSNISEDDKVILICKSGARSKSAAEYLTAKGFKFCFNCLYGFEGIHDQNEHRGNVNGWKFSSLPWKQM